MPLHQYDSDFYLWTQEQAALLRAMPRSNALDIDNLAEEVEDMGRAELNKVASLLTQVLAHLLAIALEPAAPARAHWVGEILAFQADARRAFSPGMRQRLDVADMWHDAARQVVAELVESGRPRIAAPPSCPLSLDTLLAHEFDHEAALAAIAAALSPAPQH
jgi:hypothetical protein